MKSSSVTWQHLTSLNQIVTVAVSFFTKADNTNLANHLADPAAIHSYIRTLAAFFLNVSGLDFLVVYPTSTGYHKLPRPCLPHLASLLAGLGA
jgi:hypothetical protein